MCAERSALRSRSAHNLRCAVCAQRSLRSAQSLRSVQSLAQLCMGLGDGMGGFGVDIRGVRGGIIGGLGGFVWVVMRDFDGFYGIFKWFLFLVIFRGFQGYTHDVPIRAMYRYVAKVRESGLPDELLTYESG